MGAGRSRQHCSARRRAERRGCARRRAQRCSDRRARRSRAARDRCLSDHPFFLVASPRASARADPKKRDSPGRWKRVDALPPALPRRLEPRVRPRARPRARVPRWCTVMSPAAAGDRGCTREAGRQRVYPGRYTAGRLPGCTCTRVAGSTLHRAVPAATRSWKGRALFSVIFSFLEKRRKLLKLLFLPGASREAPKREMQHFQ